MRVRFGLGVAAIAAIAASTAVGAPVGGGPTERCSGSIAPPLLEASTELAETAAGRGPGARCHEDSVRYFKTPSGNIVCNDDGGRLVQCRIRSGLSPRPSGAPCQKGMSYNAMVLFPSGRTLKPSCGYTAASTFPQSDIEVVAYGTAWKRPGLTCSSRFEGLTCRNREGHGFFLSRERWRVF
jgi:hypothetical protein